MSLPAFEESSHPTETERSAPSRQRVFDLPTAREALPLLRRVVSD